MEEDSNDLYEGGAAGAPKNGSVIEVKCPRCGGPYAPATGGCIDCGYDPPLVVVERELLPPGRLERLVADLVLKLTNNKED